MPHCTAEAVISVLLSIFSFWGLPKKLVSDNGPPFSSNTYKQFCTKFDIKLLYSPVSHPQSNAQVERSVQICKKALKKLCLATPEPSSPQWQNLLSQFLFCYLNTPTTTHNKTPNQLLLSYTPRTLLTNLHPRLHASSFTPVLPFKDGDYVYVKIGSAPVLKALVVRSLSATRYLVSVEGVLKKKSIVIKCLMHHEVLPCFIVLLMILLLNIV